MTKYEIDKLIGSKILSIRKSKNITRVAVADYLQVSKVHVHNIETGYYSTGIFNFIKLCEILECELVDIFPTKQELDLIKYFKVGNIYNYYDDGKINLSRRYFCKLLEIIPFDKVGSELLQEWKSERWIDVYNAYTDYFLKAELFITEYEKISVYFVRDKDNKWFSLGEYAGRLDYNGEITKQLENV